MVISVPSKEEILDNYARRLAATGNNRKAMVRHARHYLDYAEGDYSRESVVRFMTHLEREHKYAAYTRKFIWQILHALYVRNHWEWEFNRGDGPIVRETDINAPALAPNAVRRAIAALKDEPKYASEAAFFALSTTYGCRQEELLSIKPEDVRLQDQTLHISTVKHGVDRTHFIPYQILYYLYEHDFSKVYSSNGLWQMWGRIEYLVGADHVDRVGWHSVRRTLTTLLNREFHDETTVNNFLRWKAATSTRMTQRYSRISFVDWDETNKVEVSGDSLSVDQLVFSNREDGTARHPFLDDWK